MALDINSIRDRLQVMQSQTKKQDHFWKPTSGKHIIRIVPYKYCRENPFIELLFHYNIADKPYLSPQTFNRPDPIVEYAEKLKLSRNKDDWKLGKGLDPKLRTYVPIVVRGKESEGVKFWGFGKTVYQELLSLISDPEYGDITDVSNGHDITVEFKTATEIGKSFPTTTIRAKPSKTKLVDTSEQLKALMESQKNILEIYKEPTYDELTEVLEKWLSGDTGNEPETKQETVSQYAKNTASVNRKSDTPEKSPMVSDMSNIEADLSSLFED